MQDIIDQISTYLKGIWIKKWLVLLTAWLVCIVGWPVVLKLPDQYQAKAQIYIDSDSLLRPLLRGIALQTNPTQQINMMVKTLMTRPNLEKIARLTDLDLTTNTAAEFDELIKNLKSDIQLARAGRENLYTITYESNDPVLAKNIVQSTLTTLVENTLGDKREDTDSAQGFLDQQIEEYEQRLNDTENQLKEFKRRNVGMMPGEQGDFYSRLERTKLDLRSVLLDLKEAETRYNSIKNQIEGEEPTFGLVDSPVQHNSQFSSKYDSRIDALESSLDQLKLKFTEAHPDIKEIKRTLEDLYQNRKSEQDEYSEALSSISEGSNPLNKNPVYQELKISLAREQSNVRTLRVRAQSYQERVKELEKKIHTIPEVEAELKALQRGYSITQEKYNELLDRRESSQLSQKAEVTTDSFQFRVIDPPRVPTKPTGPNRFIFHTLILVIGVAAGTGLAFLISQIRPVFFNTKQLSLVTGVPVLGSVTKLHSDEIIHKTRRNGIFYIAFALALVGMYLTIIAIQLNPDLNQKLIGYIPDLSEQLAPVLDPIISKLKGWF
ncbi:MAG: hypothetical protein OQK12_00575 [Motiliproteus sp.]|nr:hypothetical protein [Motiliproteus sp.]MCW9053313.1 hypothetical protein [Motiliproteus sp.]